MVHIDWQHIAIGFTLPGKSKLSICKGCIFGKLSNSRFLSHPTTTTKPIELVYMDICGPLSTPSLFGNVYFLTFIDNFTHFMMVTFLNTKCSDQVFEKSKAYHKLIRNQQVPKLPNLVPKPWDSTTVYHPIYTSTKFKVWMPNPVVYEGHLLHARNCKLSPNILGKGCFNCLIYIQ